MKNQLIINIIIILGGLVGLLSSIYIINYDYIYSIQEIFYFSEKKIYEDYFPFVGIGSPLIFGSIASIFLNKIYFVLIFSFLFNALYTQIFYKITYFITNNATYSYCAAITGAVWFATNFGLAFYQDYISYYFYLLAVYFSFKRDKIFYNLLTAFVLIMSFHFKNSIGLISISIFFLVDFLISQKNINLKIKIKTFLYFNFFLIITLLLIYLFFNFKNYFDYTFKILIIEGKSRINEYTGYSSNNFLFQYVIEIFYNLIFPFKINILDAFYEKSIGRLIFIPFILIYYFFSFFAILNLNRIFKKSFDDINIKIFYFIFISSFLIGVIAGRDFTHLTFGIPIISFSILFFFNKKKNIIFVYFLLFIFLLTNILYKYYHSSFYRHIYNEPISTEEIEPLKFYNLKSQINTLHLLDSYNFIKDNNLDDIIFLGHNSKVISFLVGKSGLEYDSYYHYDISNHNDRFTYSCNLYGISNCETYMIDHLNESKSKYIVVSDNFYYEILNNFYSYLKDNYFEIYNKNSILIYEKK